MSVLEDEVKLVHTLNNDLGGAIDVTAEVSQSTLTNNIFDQITAKQGEDGFKDYRCLYITNRSVTDTLKKAFIYLETQPSNPDVRIELGIGKAGLNADEATIPDRITPPQGVAFVRADSADNGIDLGDIPNLGFRSIWVKRIVNPNTVPHGINNFTLTILGETD